MWLNHSRHVAKLNQQLRGELRLFLAHQHVQVEHWAQRSVAVKCFDQRRTFERDGRNVSRGQMGDGALQFSQEQSVACGGNALFGMLNTPCPCGNNTGIFDSEGCQSSLGFGARLRASGDASLSADSLVLNCLQLPNTWAFVVQGATYSPTGAVFGDGVSCMTGPLTRIATRHATNMSVRYPSAGDAPLSVAGGATPSSTLLYQVLYRNAAPYCTSATFNVSDGAAAVWAP